MPERVRARVTYDTYATTTTRSTTAAVTYSLKRRDHGNDGEYEVGNPLGESWRAPCAVVVAATAVIVAVVTIVAHFHDAAEDTRRKEEMRRTAAEDFENSTGSQYQRRRRDTLSSLE